MHTRRRSLAVAVIALVAVVVGACGDDSTNASDSTTTSASTTTSGSTTTIPDCTLDGATTAKTTGDAALEAGANAALLRNLQVESSDCTDAIVLLFFRGTPGYTVEYQPGPFTADPSGKDVPVAGSVFLTVRLFPASGVDLTTPDATQIYAGQPVLTPASPSTVAEVHQLGDFEAVNSWVIGLDAKRPFTVERTESTLVIRVEATAPRDSSCSVDGVTATFPAGWFVDVGSPPGCQTFDPAPFAILPQTDSVDWAVRVEASTTPFDEAVGRWTGGNTAKVVRNESTTIDGHRATVIEIESNGTGLAPAGWRSYAYVVDRDAAGTVTVVVASTAPGSTYDTRRHGADEIANALQLS